MKFTVVIDVTKSGSLGQNYSREDVAAALEEQIEADMLWCNETGYEVRVDGGIQ